MTSICNSKRNNFETAISNIKYLSSDVMEITFKIMSHERMSFIPGQFILVKISNSPMIMRPYSVLNYNTSTNEVSIAVKKVEGGEGTKIIFDTFKLGLEVEIMGAMGESLIVDKKEADLLLVATGIGITPIMCILKDLHNSNYSGNITFMYGARTKSELFYLDEIEKIISENKNIKFNSVLSREAVEGSYKGYVTDLVKDMNLEGKHIYMCSSRAVASSFKEVLEMKKFNLSKFSCESA